jgi:protein-S-isoprenylcysteine O-methyltransferase Ste14
MYTFLTTEQFSRIAGVVFAVAALAQLGRASMGMPMMAGSMMVPMWISWLAFLIFAGLAWLGLTARKT